jgi:hypothetical protein
MHEGAALTIGVMGSLLQSNIGLIGQIRNNLGSMKVGPGV